MSTLNRLELENEILDSAGRTDDSGVQQAPEELERLIILRELATIERSSVAPAKSTVHRRQAA
jgi:hypothetical protein